MRFFRSQLDIAVFTIMLLSFTYRASSLSRLPIRPSSTRLYSSVETSASTLSDFLLGVAKVEIPRRLPTLLHVLDKKAGLELVEPTKRSGMNPFVIPLARNTTDNSIIGFMRWPTQKDGMDLQIVRTTEIGVFLEALSTDNYCHRQAVEMDFYCLPDAQSTVEMLNKDGEMYTIGDYFSFLKSGKFPAITENDLRLVLDRYLLTKVGSFPDCYERLATNFLNTDNEVSALVTCERAVSVFYGWGHPVSFHTQVLKKCGRDKEARDSARASFGMPAWTVAPTMKVLEETTLLAGFTSTAILGEMHKYRSSDPREGDIAEGLSPIQVTLDQAAHLVDAVALGSVEGGWDACRADLAKKYEDGGYPDMAKFILAV